MMRSRLGLLGLCAVVLGMMAFGMTAHGEEGAQWLVLDEDGTALDTATLPAGLQWTVEKNDVSLLTTLFKVALKVLCTASSPMGAGLVAEGKLKLGFKAKFTGCQTFLNGSATPSASCVPHSSGAPAGTIETTPLNGLIVLPTGKVKLVLVEPEMGETMATLLMSELCPLGESIPIKGKLYLKDSENMLEAHEVVHLVEQGPLTDLWVLSKTAEHVVTLDGSAEVFLTGLHLDRPWGGMPA